MRQRAAGAVLTGRARPRDWASAALTGGPSPGNGLSQALLPSAPRCSPPPRAARTTPPALPASLQPPASIVGPPGCGGCTGPEEGGGGSAAAPGLGPERGGGHCGGAGPEEKLPPAGSSRTAPPPPGGGGAMAEAGGAAGSPPAGQGCGVQVSVIVPVHNSECWLDECLKSVWEQDFKQTMELSVFNDASKDSSAEIITKWKVKLEDAGVPVIIGSNNSSQPRGVGFAKNQAVIQSSGAYLCFLDSIVLRKYEHEIHCSVFDPLIHQIVRACEYYKLCHEVVEMIAVLLIRINLGSSSLCFTSGRHRSRGQFNLHE
nr:UDP-GlcNAc:betaGal beta-1,3-N-acetylglucosaminyltransferase-like protein 1 isoform X8 [Anser cygnoides]